MYDNCGKKQEPPVQVSSVHPARETQGTNNGWMDIRARFNKDVELLQQPLKVGDRVLSNGDLCELTQIGDDLIPQVERESQLLV